MRSFLWLLASFSLLSLPLRSQIPACDHKQYTVIVILEAKPGRAEELKRCLLAVAAQSAAEYSNLEYRLFQDRKQREKFALFEVWRSQDWHQKQFDKPYIQTFCKDAMPLLARPYVILSGDGVLEGA